MPDQRELSSPSMVIGEQHEIRLSEEEAYDLAAHLKQRLQDGTPLDADPDSIAKMVAGLGDPRGLLRLRFADSLGNVGSAAVPALCQAMRSSNQVTVRRAAAKTLTLIADEKSIPELLDSLLKDPDSVVQGSAMGALAAIGAPAVEAVFSILENPDSSEMQRGLANWALSFIGDKAPDSLRAAARSKNPDIRQAAIAALGSQIQSMGDEQARELLTSALNDPISNVRAEAATLLGKLQDSEWAAPLLIPKLKDEDSWVRKNSALSLMKLDAISAIQDLSQCAEQEADSVVKAVMTLAIKQIESNN